MKKPTKKQIATAAVILLIFLVALVILVKGCSDDEAFPAQVAAEAAEPTIAWEDKEDNAPEEDASSAESSAEEGLDTQSESSTDDMEGSRIPSAPPAPSAANEWQGNGANGPSANVPATQQSAPKQWVEDTERVWVADPDWTEKVPVYGTKEVSICNICNEDITGNVAAHGKSHMLAGEGSGHHSEVRQTVTYETVTHSGGGHWETRVTGGHWE